jgi:hypothetical protein
MAPKGSSKGKGQVRAKMPTSVINRRLSLDRESVKGFISEHICGLIHIYNVSGVKDERAWDLFYDIIFLDPVMARHISQFQLMWGQQRRRSSPFREWWAAFRTYMGQMFDKTRDQKNNWRWDILHAFVDQVDRSNPQTTSSGKVQCTSECFSWYGSDDLRAKIEPPICQQYMPGDILAVRPRNLNEIIDKYDNDENWGDTGAPSGGRSYLGDGNDNENGEGEEDTKGGEKGTGKGNGTTDGRGKGKGKGKRNGKRKGIVNQTPGGDDNTRAIALQLQKERNEADSGTEG